MSAGWLPAACGAALVAGCAGTGAAPPEPGLRVLEQRAQCARTQPEPGAQWVLDQRDWDQVHATWRARAGAPQPGTPPAVDFANERVLVIYQGQRPSAGYALRLAAAAAEGERLQLRVRGERPAPGYSQAQVLTSPCLVLAIDRRYALVILDDGAGRLQRLEPPRP